MNPDWFVLPCWSFLFCIIPFVLICINIWWLPPQMIYDGRPVELGGGFLSCCSGSVNFGILWFPSSLDQQSCNCCCSWLPLHIKTLFNPLWCEKPSVPKNALCSTVVLFIAQLAGSLPLCIVSGFHFPFSGLSPSYSPFFYPQVVHTKLLQHAYYQLYLI